MKFPRISISLALIAATAPALGAGLEQKVDQAVAHESGSLLDSYDVVIAGGTTAALAAAVASAELGARTCLLEPTDWIGGQLTATGVPAVDEAWHRIVDPTTGKVVLDVAAIARSRENMTPTFRDMLAATGNPGRGWVSRFCFEPRDFLAKRLLPIEERQKDRLVVYRNTVVKQVEADPRTRRVRSITAIRRLARPGVAQGGYDVLPSKDLPDWYDPDPSPRFAKEVLQFVAKPKGTTVFLDATDWGEVLALSGASYLQGVEAVDGGRDGDDSCGQTTVFGFVERIEPRPVAEPPNTYGADRLGFGQYREMPDAWARIWTYRRLRSKEDAPAVGDLSLQNWGYSGKLQEGGNDYPFSYLFKGRKDTSAELKDWRGGIDLAALGAAERRALAWHYWFKEHAPKPFEPGQVVLDRESLGTGHGLSKLPYIRDTRRSIGLDGFILKAADLTGPPSQKTGKRFMDRVALGAYTADIHPMVGCEFPAYVFQVHETLPFCIPFRALTSETHDNLLVAGKTMAQSFLANAATRLHPIEWSSGTAAGVVAAEMARRGWTSRQALDHIAEVQAMIKTKTPIDWTIDGEVYPSASEAVSL
jgi:hypothetical protein